MTKKLIELIKRFFRSQFFSFGIVGAIGFLIDAIIFYLMHQQFNIVISRCASILTALIFTWLANRLLTFKIEYAISLKEFLRYLSVNISGALINLSIFLVLCKLNFFLRTYFLLAMLIATFVSMLFNFTLSRLFVFGK